MACAQPKGETQGAPALIEPGFAPSETDCAKLLTSKIGRHD
jgi:hypothetical protein